MDTWKQQMQPKQSPNLMSTSRWIKLLRRKIAQNLVIRRPKPTPKEFAKESVLVPKILENLNFITLYSNKESTNHHVMCKSVLNLDLW